MDIKGKKLNYSIMTYVTEQIKNSRPELYNWTSSLSCVLKAAGFSVKAMGAEADGILFLFMEVLMKYLAYKVHSLIHP